MTSLEQAQKLAIATDRLIVVDFWASWCGPCKRMDRESWQSPEVSQLLNKFIPLKLDLDKSREIARKYEVKGIPYIFIIDGNGEIVYKNIGYLRKTEVLKVLEKYALNTEFIRKESLDFYQHENYVTSIRLGEKYLDYALFVNNDVRWEFIEMGKVYLKKGEKMLDKEQSNYNMMREKIDLLQLTAELYKGNFKKVGRNLEKMDEANLNKLNQKQFAFLQYCIAREEKDVEGSKKWMAVFSSENIIADNERRFELLSKSLALE
ncbi:thioredoxin family protein [Antarcticibacterium sp. 1MA-6-2]|uniref:thioredoxin family protein n=1 Tax=Antarcticibacterium sp. 1MA-6-2 TaxID=2908210 RepID=UPI001F2A749E|nr:thioredoxin family protein [Antarcticibacterium sp. 1MA-6-2]UJH92436.1 thioredoxin family protein [Antarcticibacterium sp. 1MA-6-2]